MSRLVRVAVAAAALALLATCGGGDDKDRATANGEPARAQALAIATPAGSKWSALIPLPITPSSGANLPNGKLVFWSANDRFSFGGTGQTYTSLFDPATLTASETLVTQTGHDMFCSGTSNLPDGTLLVNGGDDSAKTSLYNPSTGAWATGAAMNIPRGYEGNTVLQDGSVLTLGGSWSGGSGNKHGERWSAASGWTRLTGVPSGPIEAPDPAGVYRGDNHLWLFTAPNGQVLHAGPSANMNWISTQGVGQIVSAGTRGDDVYSQSGNAVMYDIGKILKMGGSTAYDNRAASAASYVIDVNAGVSVRKVASMAYPRIFGNAVVLPNGQVVVLGGQTIGKTFSDDNSVLVPELWDPVSETFMPLPPMAVGRNYHSIGLLLPDGRVLSGGGGLCGATCPANHPNAQILTPNYLFNADGTAATRPVLQTVPAEATHGTTVNVITGAPVATFSLVRMSSTTHTVNNDQRRIPLQFSAGSGNSYALSIPSNPGVVLPGYYMLFAMNADGVPSVSKPIRITGTGAPVLTTPATQHSAVGTPASMPVTATTASGTLSYAAMGLPPGLGINTATGLVSGTPTTTGLFTVTVSASNAAATTSTNMSWRVEAAGSSSVYHVKFEAISEINGNPWASMAEFNLLDSAGAVMSRTGWSVSASSAETRSENGAASRAVDGDPITFWHTQYDPTSTPMPHSFTVNLGGARILGGFKYLPRPNAFNGTVANWRFHTSSDGVNWTLLTQGTFANTAAEKTVTFAAAATNRPPTIAAVPSPSHAAGQNLTLSLSASDPDGDPLSFSATGLPPGLVLNTASGVISGQPSASGTYGVTAQVADGRGASASTSFSWTITSADFAIAPVAAPPLASGGTASFAVSSNGGSGVRFRWNFGDGSPETADSTSTSITHTYTGAGLYAVTVTATDAAGNVKTLRFNQAVYTAALGTARPVASSNVVLETRSGASARVWLVNQDADSVSVFDTANSAKLAEVAVGLAPRSLAVAPDGRIWVANKGSSSLSVISPTTLAVVQTVATPRASMPYGIAFAPDGLAAYLTLEATGQVHKLNVSSGAVIASANVGAAPRHLSIAADSSRVLVSRFITPPLPGEGTATVQTESGGVKRGGEVVVLNAALAIERTIVLEHSEKADNTLQGRGIPNYLAAAVIAPDGRAAWLPSKQDNIKRGSLRDGQNIDFQNTVRAISSRIDLTSMAEDHAGRIDHDNSSLASAAVFHPSGAYLFIALQTSRQVAVVDPVGKREILRFDAGRAPDGLTVSPDGLKLYVNNFMDRSLGVFDLTRLVNFGELVVTAQASVAAVTTEKLSAQVLAGKRLFYDARDPRLARDAYMSCASCHNDGGQDGRVWDMTGQGEGLRNTIALRGRAGGQGFKHWSANFDEIQDFEGQIRSLSQGSGLMSNADFNTATRSQPLGTAKAGVSVDLDALAAYVASLNAFDPSPWRNADGSLTAAGTAGKTVFDGRCASCHSGTAFTESAAGNLRDIGTLKASSGNRLGAPLAGIDTPTLRDAWASAPFLHDGSAASITAAVQAHTAVTLSAAELANVAAFVQQIGREETSAGAAPSGIAYVKLEALTEINGNPWASMAEFNLQDTGGALLARTGWVVSADSAETRSENGAATRAVDGDPNTFWHTQYDPTSTPMPHSFTVNLGTSRVVGGFKYLPRPGAFNGTIKTWRFSTSPDGIAWTQVAAGSFASDATEKTVTFAAPAANQPPSLAAVANRSDTVGTAVTLALAGSDADGDPLTYSATGLPAGMSLNTGTGAISGTPTTAGTYSVTAQVADGRGGAASSAFTWTINASTAPPAAGSVRFVRLEAISEINGNPWTSMAEFNLIDASSVNIPRTGWVVSADSVETRSENGAATRAVDGDPNTFWHTQYDPTSTPMPHSFTVDLGTSRVVGGFKYLPRPGAFNGTILGWRFYRSADGVSWTLAGQGSFARTAAEKVVMIAP